MQLMHMTEQASDRHSSDIGKRALPGSWSSQSIDADLFTFYLSYRGRSTMASFYSWSCLG